MVQNYLFRRKQTYYFRWKVPVELVQVFGSVEIRKSLRTACKLEASARASKLLSEVSHIKQARRAYLVGEIDQKACLAALENSARVIKTMTKATSMMRLITVNLPGNIEAKIDYDGDYEKETQAADFLVKNSQKSVEKSISGSNGVKFSHLFLQFMEYKVNHEKLNERMCKEYTFYYQTLNEFMEDEPINLITRRTLKNALGTYANLPKRNKREYKDIPVLELLEMDIPEEDKVSEKTVNQVKKLLQGMFNFSVEEEMLKDSPARNLKLNFSKEKTFSAFTDSEVNILLDMCRMEEEPWKKWMVYLAAFTGARRKELAQLRKKDIRFDEQSNRYYILITDAAGGVKTNNSIRQVPLHQELIDMGFLEFIEKCDQNLFQDLNPESVTKWFARKREKLSIDACDDYGNRKVFHSFRHTVITKSQAAKNPTLHVQQVVGHEKKSMGVTDRYTHTLPLKDVLDVIDSIEY